MSKRRERKRAADAHEAAHIASRKHLGRAVWFAKTMRPSTAATTRHSGVASRRPCAATSSSSTAPESSGPVGGPRAAGSCVSSSIRACMY